jgi:hypothetical protein
VHGTASIGYARPLRWEWPAPCVNGCGYRRGDPLRMPQFGAVHFMAITVAVMREGDGWPHVAPALSTSGDGHEIAECVDRRSTAVLRLSFASGACVPPYIPVCPLGCAPQMPRR